MKQGGGGSLDQVVKLLQRGGRVGLLIGAGVSVSAGLPDFRSPGGMYDTLRPELLTATDAQKSSMRADPTNVVSWRIFSQNQFVYHEVRRPFILGIAQGQWKPTLSHFFIRVLQDKNLLEMLFSCNIDGLDHSAGITRIVNVHGSIGRAECEGCGAPFPWAEYTNLVRSNIRDIYGTDPQAPSVSSNIPCRSCGANLVKPATVLYGRALPQSFFEAMNDSGPKVRWNGLSMFMLFFFHSHPSLTFSWWPARHLPSPRPPWCPPWCAVTACGC